MRTGAPFIPNTQSATTEADQLLSGASYCWEYSVLKNSIATTDNPEITPLRTNDKSPMGLSLYTSRALQTQLNAGPFSSRHLIDGLLAELTLRAKDAGRRKVPWLHWQIPHALLDSAEVMELMYFVGKQFQLGESNSCHYSVCFTSEELERKRAALFKGLGFTCLELQTQCSEYDTNEIENKDLTEKVTAAASICQDYHYSHFALRVNDYAPQIIESLRKIQLDQSRLPDSISIEHCQFASEQQYQHCFFGLKDLGYRVLGNDFFVRPGTDLADAQIHHHLKLSTRGYNSQNVVDIMGLGPDNYSTLNHTRYQNQSELPAYLADPTGKSFIASTSDRRIKLVIDHLLCYHRLDLKYFDDRYGLDLRSILDNVWGPLADDTRLQLNKNQLQLTSEGIFQLTPLCQSLINHFC